MDCNCKGIGNWFNCLRCPYLCTPSCPIEDENAINRFIQYINEQSTTVAPDNFNEQVNKQIT